MPLAGTIAAKFSTARRQPAFVLIALVPVWILIALSALTIALVPFRRIASRLGDNLGAVGLCPVASDAEERRAVLIARAITVAAKYAPFRSDCYPQAIAARLLCALYRLPYAVHFGTAGGGAQKLRAHAWVVCGRVALSGRLASFAQYTPVSCFVPPALSAARSPAPGPRLP